MASLARSIPLLSLLRSAHARPSLVSAAILPPRLTRGFTITPPAGDPPDDSTLDTDTSEQTNFELVSSGSISQHPFASQSNDPSSSFSWSNPDEPSSSTSVVTSLPSPPPPIPVPTPPHLQHPFDTHAFVTYLEKSGLTRGTSITLMEAVKGLIVKRTDKARDEMVEKENMENGAYLFRAALSELRTELSVRARNDRVALRAMTGAIQREVDALETKLKEDVQTLKHDIEMDMNNRKSETRSDQKGFDIAIEEINNKFTISLGDLRTEIESAKWDATRRAISIIALLVVAGVAVTLYTSTEPDPPPAEGKPVPTTMRDMAVGTDDDSMEDRVVEDTERKLEQLLSEEIPVKNMIRSSRRGSQSKPKVDRI